MFMGVYKPGQGYWVRVLTAVAVGIIMLFGASWAWKQAEAVRLPAKQRTMSTSAGRAEPPVGDTVTLLRYAGSCAAHAASGPGAPACPRPLSTTVCRRLPRSGRAVRAGCRPVIATRSGPKAKMARWQSIRLPKSMSVT